MEDSRALIAAANHYGVGVSQAFREPDTLRNSLHYHVAAIGVAWRDLKRGVLSNFQNT
ncbi:hypothetical protein J1TS1_28270 [Shouchella clausii]|uniref:hypothetical protein n=1 Tax=Shouchella clausii TaxID=79880 RepID=UPI001B004869|nr:hypothetical protein [Shouchella clausii]GIN08682.1 hypothetical protein J1TS1_28270 [Shouchella clausii]